MQRACTCCFTGSRPEYVGFDSNDITLIEMIQRDLNTAIRQATANGYTDFLCGMSRGFDLWAGEAVAALVNEFPIRLHAAIPFRGQTNGWNREDLTSYENVLRACTSTYILAEKYRHGVYYARNRFMVDNSSLVIAWNRGRKSGGTLYTCRYAKKNNISIINLADPQMGLHL